MRKQKTVHVNRDVNTAVQAPIDESSPMLSHFQASVLLSEHKKGVIETETSTDLNVSTHTIQLNDNGVQFTAVLTIPWQLIEEISDDENSCYVVDENGITKIQTFSEETNRYYSLYPTTAAPTMLISGIPMHRIKGTDPQRDTAEKIKAARPIRGCMLDTATGLGYTAIAAARRADHVTTIEFDPAALEICRQNPWSAELFDNPKITQRIGDAYDVVPEFEDAAFDGIIHDPPMFSLAGHLYSADFYCELHRVLAPKGRLFHYIGDPDSKSGANVTRGVIRRLHDVGFRKVQKRPRAFGVVAVK